MSNSNQSTTSLFLGAWAVLPPVEFYPAWKNNTGYLDRLCTSDLGLQTGQLVRCTDDLGRKMIIKCLAPGLNQVVFERGTKEVFVSNEPHPKHIKTPIAYSSSWSYKTMEAFLGLREHTLTFHSGYVKEFFAEKGIDMTTELSKKIYSSEAFTYEEVEKLDIDPYSAITAMYVKGYNL